MWCKKCNRETQEEICEICGSPAEIDVPINIYWCSDCNIPIIKEENAIDKLKCSSCRGKLKYLSTDLRPVFPEERLLIEILLDKPMEFYKDSVWASDNRYYINGEVITINSKLYKKYSADYILKKLEEYKNQNTYEYFNKHIEKFNEVNKERLNYLYDEACEFIKDTRKNFPLENIILSFSGGKDSTVTADLVVRALSEPSLVHIFGDTTLEFPMTQEYVRRFREKNMMSIFKVCKNKEQDFFKVCEDIGPPARMLRWCCSMFKTGPITRVLNNLYKDKDVLTFYGIRKCESISRSKYNRVENKAGSVKINKQTVASPIFYWKDIDIWLYMLTEKIDFNDAYRLGYDRVGCWCCPNSGERAVFLSNIYMPEQSRKWRNFLVGFAKQIGKTDPEVYVDTGKWKARQGGNGIKAANDVKIKFANCTTEENAKVYQLNKEIPEWFYTLFIPFGKLAPELGRKLLNEMIIVDLKTNIPIISIQPFSQDGFEYSVKVKTMNVKNHEDLQRQISYQIKKFNACRKCLKCESLCKHGTISIIGDEYFINNEKCKRCKMCVSPKYLTGGCLMDKYLKTKTE